MTVLIARSANSPPRIFPAIGPELYLLGDEPLDLTPDEQAARYLLSLANKEFSPTERFLGLRLDSLGQIGRLLLLHKHALEAELAGKWQRADYFWDMVQEQIAHLANKSDTWQVAAESMANQAEMTVLTDPTELHQRLVAEIFIDTHCAFYNSHLQDAESLTWESRAFAHLDYIRGLIEFSALSADDLLTVLAPALEKWITLYEEAKQWEQGLRVCTDLHEHFPDVETYQNRLAMLLLASTLSKLKQGKSPKANLKDAEILEQRIGHLVIIHHKYPYNFALFDVLGHLHHQRAISLANGKHLSQAILCAQKAVTYNPSLAEAKETRESLIQAMQGLQTQMQGIEAQLGQDPRATLNAEGIQLRDQATQGFRPLNTYIKSKKAKSVLDTYYAAQARAVWRDIGLAEPAERWDERAQILLSGLSDVMSEPPERPDDIAATWDNIVAQQPKLADLDATLICAYLAQRLFGVSQAEEEQPAANAQPSFQEPPLMSGLSAKGRWSWEPFTFWLFNGQDKRIKLQAAVAIILMLLVSGLAIRDFTVRSARDTAYAQIVEGYENQEYLSIIEGAEGYLANPPFSGQDERDEQVLDIYDEAFVRWFVGLEGEIDSDAQTYIERYQTLRVDSSQQGGQ